MRAYRIINRDLTLDDIDLPKIKDDHVMVKIKSIGLNRADILQISGLYPSPDGADIPGIEFSGVRLDTNEEVMGIIPSGAFAEYANVHERNLMIIPKNIALIDAASLPESLLTVWMNLVQFGRLKPRDKVLIHGGTSGIGSMAIQIAKHLGNFVITTVGSDEKFEFCKKIGADMVLNYKNKFFEHVKKNGGADVILDILGAKYFSENIACLNKFGRLQIIAFLNGAEATINLGQIVHKNLRIRGSTLRTRSINKKYELIESVIDNLYKPISEGKIKPIIDSYYDFENLPDAIARMKSGIHKGKIIIKVA